ncbi:hypothetical protein OAC50_00905 [bacterium]|jgi:hypothetical protein|nr:hypothetical protein [bacterium]|tara:strand:- start:1353 stop:1622 length:270 start_codon:yes stop_codon:yes gene_type:complete
MSEKLFEVKIINSRGAYHHLMRIHGEENWKHHKWDGPAIIPHRKDSEFKKSYFLNGNEYNPEEYSEILKEREGLPWYKTAMGRAGENRN